MPPRPKACLLGHEAPPGALLLEICVLKSAPFYLSEPAEDKIISPMCVESCYNMSSDALLTNLMGFDLKLQFCCLVNFCSRGI